ncbi:MAG: hypothetical protein F4Y60_08165 [Boseongicola sp. SB0664_bin_43]|uniref:Uncharacterized protein n=1 Tax=Boseongicola sp. SB0664_bin_43 TaxID=2604844 RepID=A0A6B0Y1X9_9RHOB|nr:hypothetical protein [Boseongicola sp. SB0664_bin_43]
MPRLLRPFLAATRALSAFIGDHAANMPGGAGWHRSRALTVPDNMSLLHPPPGSPQPNPVKQVFACLGPNFPADRLLPTVEDVRSAMLDAWQALATNLERIGSIT